MVCSSFCFSVACRVWVLAFLVELHPGAASTPLRVGGVVETQSSTSSAPPLAFGIKIFRRKRHAADCRKESKTANQLCRRTRPRTGSFVTWKRPTPERLGQWFGHTVANPNFNHDSVGMTKPPIIECTETTTMNNSSVMIMDEERQFDNPKSPSLRRGISGRGDKSWRLLEFHRCSIGHGEECYRRVCDAALDWSFNSTSKGILVIQPENFASTKRRSLVTYTFVRLLPKRFSRLGIPTGLFCLSPVHVVYSIRDQECTNGKKSNPAEADFLSRFTSTAYATGKGHWICGEERVKITLQSSGAVDLQIISLSRPAPSLMGLLVWPFIGRMQRTFFEQQLDSLSLVASPMRLPSTSQAHKDKDPAVTEK